MYATGLSTTASHANREGSRRLRGWLAAARQESGANVIEMAFIAMFMFILIGGIVDLGGAYQQYIVAINSSREGARLYARVPCTSTNRAAVKDAVIEAAVNGVVSGEMNETVMKEADELYIGELRSNITLAPDPSSACPTPGGTVRVTVQINYNTLMGQFWGANTLPIRAQTSMMFYESE